MNTKLVLIYSHCGKKPSKYTLNMASMSNYLAQKNGYRTILYVDKKNKSYFSKIKYSEIKEFDDEILNKIPSIVWSAGKILAASMETRPFFHIDFDLFIINNNFFNFVKTKEFVVYHGEPWWNEPSAEGKKFVKGIKYLLNKTENVFKIKTDVKNLKCCNFAIFGSYKKKNIKIINKECKSIINSLIKHCHTFQKFQFRKFMSNTICGESSTTVIIEQVFTLEKIRKKLGSFYCLLDIKSCEETFTEGLKIGLLHLWGSKYSRTILKELENKLKDINL